MIYKNLSHKTLLVLVTCITSICILAFGMRGPDLSRPHRPKPKPRAYVEEQFKKSPENLAKKPVDHLQADLPPNWTAAARVTFRTAYPSSFQCAAASPAFYTPSRAPPASSA